jgi:hypothetical protein
MGAALAAARPGEGQALPLPQVIGKVEIADQWPQVAQLPPAQEAQLLPVPAMGWLPPLLLLLTAENREMARAVSALPHWVQVAGAFALLIGRNFSNVVPQLAHVYSYRGIELTPHSTEFGS